MPNKRARERERDLSASVNVCAGVCETERDEEEKILMFQTEI